MPGPKSTVKLLASPVTIPEYGSLEASSVLVVPSGILHSDLPGLSVSVELSHEHLDPVLVAALAAL